MHSHTGMKGGHLFRKFLARLFPQAGRPLTEHIATGPIKPGDVFIRQLDARLNGDSRGAQQNLVGVRITDAGEHMLVRERAFERVVARRKPLRKGRKIDGEHLETARVEIVEILFTTNETQ